MPERLRKTSTTQRLRRCTELRRTLTSLKQRGAAYLRKWKGVNGAAAPKLVCTPLALRNASFTWLGVFLTLLALSGANQLMVRLSDGDRFVMLGSFGALMTLVSPNPRESNPHVAL